MNEEKIGMNNADDEVIPVILDAMGGDYGPSVTVPAAIAAVERGGVSVALSGDSDILERELDKYDNTAKRLVKIVPAEGIVEEGESPVQSMRENPNASVFVCAAAVKKGTFRGFVSMGSTGASMAAATIMFGTLDGIERGALGGSIIGYSPHTVIMDLGANVDTRPKQLVDFAALGSVMAQTVYGVRNPKVALLSIGAEEKKGNNLVRQTRDILQSISINFIGNVEGHELVGCRADVVLCDGFVGNIVLKLTEGLGRAISKEIIEELGNTDQAHKLARKVLDRTSQSTSYGGGPILGVNGISIIGHGASGTKEVVEAIHTARVMIKSRLVEAQAEALAGIRVQM